MVTRKMPSNASFLKEIIGVVTNVSHIFMLKKQHLFVFNIASETGIFSVVVRKQSQFAWHASLSIGSVYSCHNLRKTKLYQGTPDEVLVLVSVSETRIIPKATNNITWYHEDEEACKFISYEGTVTSSDRSLQLYELDGDCQLILTSLAAISSCPELSCGDRVVVYDAHWEPEGRRLYACARTHVRVINRCAERATPSKRTAVHTLHRFTLPPAAVWWLKRTADIVTDACGERVPTVGEHGAVHRLLLREDLPVVERSLTKEFVCRPHRCIALQKFRAPFELTPLPELVTDAVADSEPTETPDDRGWLHWVSGSDGGGGGSGGGSGGGGGGRRTVGLLSRDSGGGLRLSTGNGDGCTAVPLLLVPPTSDGRPTPAGPVLVTEPRIVVERLGDRPPLLYLLCAAEQLVALRNADSPPPPQPRPDGSSSVRLLLCQRSSPRRSASSSSAATTNSTIAAGNVCVVLHGILEEAGRRRPMLIRLTGAAAGRVAHLVRGSSYLLHSSEDPLWTGREVIGGGLQKQLRPWMAECPVLHAPDDLHFTADPSPQLLPLLGDVMSVSELTPDSADLGLLTVRGVIRERHHARDRFARSAPGAPVSLDTHRIVLVLGDAVTPDEVTLYVCDPGQWTSTSLLGLVPGAAVTAHAVRWAGGTAGIAGEAAGATHLVTTALSELEITDWSEPPEHTAAKRPRLTLPVRFLSSALPDTGTTRWVSCVTVSDVCRVSVSAACAFCGQRLAVGVCTFVGCHGSGRSVISARARAVLDDGSAAVTAQLIGDSVRQLLAVTEEQWRALTAEAEQSGEIYHLQPRAKTGRRAPAPAGLLSSICLSDAVRRPIVCELKKFADRPAGMTAGPETAQTVFCEAVMDATADVMVRLFPDRPAASAGAVGLEDVEMAG